MNVVVQVCAMLIAKNKHRLNYNMLALVSITATDRGGADERSTVPVYATSDPHWRKDWKRWTGDVPLLNPWQ